MNDETTSYTTLTPKQRYDVFQPMLTSVSQIAVLIPIELIDAMEQDAQRWGALGWIQDPTAYRQALHDRHTAYGRDVLATFAAFRRALESVKEGEERP